MKEQLLFQLNMAWELFLSHTDTLTEQEANWAFCDRALQLRPTETGFVADWPQTKAYETGPCTIRWTLWHMLYLWINAFAANLEGASVEKESICWPGSAADAVAELHGLHDRWAHLLQQSSEEDLSSPLSACWPFAGESFAEICLWLGGELMKNAAEIGAGRSLYAAAHQ